MHECVHVLVTTRMTTGMTYGLELSLGLFQPAIRGVDGATSLVLCVGSRAWGTLGPNVVAQTVSSCASEPKRD